MHGQGIAFGKLSMPGGAKDATQNPVRRKIVLAVRRSQRVSPPTFNYRTLIPLQVSHLSS
jgi:hypothetical protein